MCHILVRFSDTPIRDRDVLDKPFDAPEIYMDMRRFLQMYPVS